MRLMRRASLLPSSYPPPRYLVPIILNFLISDAAILSSSSPSDGEVTSRPHHGHGVHRGSGGGDTWSLSKADVVGELYSSYFEPYQQSSSSTSGRNSRSLSFLSSLFNVNPSSAISNINNNNNRNHHHKLVQEASNPRLQYLPPPPLSGGLPVPQGLISPSSPSPSPSPAPPPVGTSKTFTKFSLHDKKEIMRPSASSNFPGVRYLPLPQNNKKEGAVGPGAGGSGDSSIIWPNSPPPTTPTYLTMNGEETQLRFVVHKPGDEGEIRKALIEDGQQRNTEVKFVEGPTLRIQRHQKVYLPPKKKTVVYILLKEPQIMTDVEVVGPKEKEEESVPEVYITYEQSDGRVKTKHYSPEKVKGDKYLSHLKEEVVDSGSSGGGGGGYGGYYSGSNNHVVIDTKGVTATHNTNKRSTPSSSSSSSSYSTVTPTTEKIQGNKGKGTTSPLSLKS